MTPAQELNYTRYRLTCLEKLADPATTKDSLAGWKPVEFEKWVESQANPEFQWHRSRTNRKLVIEISLDDACVDLIPESVTPLYSVTAEGKSPASDFLCRNGYHSVSGSHIFRTSLPIRSWRLE